MKKIMLTTLIASMLLRPLGSTALADYEEAPAPAVSQDYLPGDMPAGTSPADAMAPALHGVLLAMMNHDVQSLDLSDGVLAWECLYNMLSLYGQLDSRSQMEDGLLLFPAETVQDYAAALDLSLEALPPLPQELTDRLTFDRGGNVYQAVCGCDDLSQLQVREVRPVSGGLQLTGALVYVVEDLDLVQFQATLQYRDSMFGFAVTGLALS